MSFLAQHCFCCRDKDTRKAHFDGKTKPTTECNKWSDVRVFLSNSVAWGQCGFDALCFSVFSLQVFARRIKDDTALEEYVIKKKARIAQEELSDQRTLLRDCNNRQIPTNNALNTQAVGQLNARRPRIPGQTAAASCREL